MNYILIKNTVACANKILKINTLMIKNIAQLETIDIILVNTEVLQAAFGILNIAYLKTFLWFSQWIKLCFHFIIKKVTKRI